MPVLTPNLREGASVVRNGASGNYEPQGKRPKFFWETKGYGVPRYEDLMTVRMIESTHTAHIPMETIEKQVTTANFTIRPTVEDPTPAHWDAADDALEFFLGRYNRNNVTFDNLLKMITNDIMSVDAGVVEKVPASDGYLAELYPRDGATITKNPDDHGRMPAYDRDLDGIDEKDYAFYQFGLPQHTSLFYDQPEAVTDELNNSMAGSGLIYTGRPTPFTRSQIAYLSENPRTWSVYGYGRLQYVRRIIELIINQNLSNKKYFPENEVPEGLVNLVDANKSELQRFRSYWKDEIEGERHKVGLVGGNVNWVPFRPSPEELEFIDSQKWYHKLVWMAFGLNQSEVGDSQQVNRATAKEDAINVYRTTTKPLINLLEAYFNQEILRFMREYDRVDGEIEFAFEIENPDIRDRKRQRDFEDLNHALKTPNDILKERGEEKVPWGDMPLTVFNQLAGQHTEWVMEEILDYDNPPEPPTGLMDADPSETKAVDMGPDEDGDADGNKKKWKTKAEIETAFKEALRNQYGGEFPPIKQHADAMEEDVEKAIKDYFEDFEDEIEDAFFKSDGTPIENKTVKLANVAEAVGHINLVRPLMAAALPHAGNAMEEGAEYEKGKIETRLEEGADEDAEVNIAFDVEDSAAHDRMRKHAAQNMQSVNDTVKNRVNTVLTDVVDEGGGVDEATERLEEEVPEISSNRARLVSRTETLESSRYGSQALGESTILVSHKEWVASSDGREREWHGVMDGVIVPKDQSFKVPNVGADNQPSDYPREAYIVGEDQPFNCRCAQQPKLRDEVEEDGLAALEEMDGVKVVYLNDRQKEVIEEKGADGEKLRDILKRLESSDYSRAKAARNLGLSKPTYYKWLEQYGLKD